MSEWRKAIGEEANKEYYKNLSRFVNSEYRTTTVYPPKEEIMAALEKTPPKNVKSVILGQDPHPEPGPAMGLSVCV